MQVLIVEDDPVTRMVAAGFLEAAGLGTLLAESAEDALARLTAAHPVELCLVDVVLPGMDGFQFCRELKSREDFRNLPVIIMTAGSQGTEVVQAFQAGAMDFIRKPIQEPELTARVRAALRLKREIDARLRNEEALLELTRLLGETNRELQQNLRVDSVTGLASRRELDTVFEETWRSAADRGGSIRLVMFDIDFFKNYNDTYGHVAGDDCLRRVAGTLLSCLTRPDEVAGRFGGEEFALLLPDSSPAAAAEKAEQIRSRVSELGLEHSGSPLGHVTISGGVSGMIVTASQGRTSLIERADQALYAAKRRGRNRIEVIES